MRLNQIDTATELEQWLEAFKTAEDIVYLIDKYEKNSDKNIRTFNSYNFDFTTFTGICCNS